MLRFDCTTADGVRDALARTQFEPYDLAEDALRIVGELLAHHVRGRCRRRRKNRRRRRLFWNAPVSWNDAIALAAKNVLARAIDCEQAR